MSLVVWLCHLLLHYHLPLCCITCCSCKAIALVGSKPAREKWLARLASGLKFGQPRAQHCTCVWVWPYSVWVYDRYWLYVYTAVQSEVERPASMGTGLKWTIYRCYGYMAKSIINLIDTNTFMYIEWDWKSDKLASNNVFDSFLSEVQALFDQHESVNSFRLQTCPAKWNCIPTTWEDSLNSNSRT